MHLFEEPPPGSRLLAPTRGLDDYIFSLQIETQPYASQRPYEHFESVFVGTGSPTEGSATLEFYPPADLHERLVDSASGLTIRVRVTVSKRFEKGRARLGQGTADYYEYETLMFYNLGSMRHELQTGPRPTSFLYQRQSDDSEGEWPELTARWHPSVFTCIFTWEDLNDQRDMSVEDACLALEHYVTWV